jgi:hypothetical protein
MEDIMKKYKVFFNTLKEEKWILEMADNGWLIEKIGLGYTFREVQKKSYNLKMDYRMFSKEDDFEEYVTMHEDYGWKHIAGDKGSGSQYFLHEDQERQNELFSDEESKRARILRIRKMLRQSIAIALVMFIVLLSQGSITISALINPKNLYLTPDLWDMSGSTFWAAFWIETPFVLFRGLFIYALPIMIIIYVVYSYKVQHDYNKSLKNIE